MIPRRPRRRPALAVIVIALTLVGVPGCDACDRSTRAGSREDPYLRTALPGGGILITERPVIPEHLRANCDVCPEWCMQVDLRPLPSGVVIANYRRHALIYADARKHPWPAGWATLEQLGCIVAGGGPALRRRFIELLSDPSPAIRWPAAVHVLQHDIDKPAALAALRAMVGRVLDDGTAEGPDGVDYANRAHFLLIDHEIGNAIELP
jgi:hypothetical protein